MRHAKFILAIVFLLTLCSGAVAGVLVSRVMAHSQTPQPQVTSLQQMLDLTADQQEKMKNIWEGVRTKMGDCVVKARDIQHRQDEALTALLNPDQKEKFNKIQEDFRRQTEDLKNAEKQAIQHAMQQTDLILNEQQRKQYHELVDKRLGHAVDSPWLSPDAATTRGS